MIDDSDPGSWARFMRHQGITPVFHPVSDQLDPSGNDQRTDALNAASARDFKQAGVVEHGERNASK